MRLLIAQGPGFYGVNIRIIDEETYERLLAKYDWKPEEVGGAEFDSVGVGLENGTTLVITQDIEPHEKFSVGFDTGWWDEGEDAIKEALK